MRCMFSLIVVVAAACSSGSGPVQHPPGGHDPPPHDGGTVTPALTDRECEELVAHAIELRIAELRATTPAERLPTDAETTALRAELLRADPGCRTLAPASYRCAMAAKTTSELAACAHG